MSSLYYLSEQAEKDIEEIVDHLLKESISVADTFIEATYHAFERLAEYPEIGHLRQDITDRPVKFWPLKWHYLIIYNPDIPVEIVRVLSGWRDMVELLEK